VPANRRVFRIGIGEQLGLGGQREICQNHLDIERAEHRGALRIGPQHQILPVQIGDSQPAEERE